MYTVTSLPFESRTRVIFRSAEFGFLGVIVRTNKHTPRFCGHLSSTGDFENFRFGLRRLADELIDCRHEKPSIWASEAKCVETNKFTPFEGAVKGGNMAR